MFGRFRNSVSGVTTPAQWLVDWFRGPESDSGVNVTVESALGYSPIWYGVNKIAGHIGLLPLNLHRRIERGIEIAQNNPVHQLMRYRPNDYQTAMTFRKTLMMHALLTGNGRAAIVRENGVPVELLPLMPANTHTCLVNGEKWHIVTSSDEERCSWVSGPADKYRDGKIYRIRDEDVLHIIGLSWNGYQGLSLVQIAKDAIGLGLAAQKATSRSFKNGSKPGVVIEAPIGMFRDDKDAKEFIDHFNDYHEGLDNQGRAALLREGMKMSTVTMSAQDAQWLEQRQFQRIDVAALLGLETLPGDADSVSYSSLEQKNIAYLQNCLGPWIENWEQETHYKLLTPREQRRLFFKFDESELLRTDNKTKAETITLLVNGRIINPNEAREKFGMNPVEGLDEFANPAITPGTPGGQSSEGEQQDQEILTPEDASRRAIVAHLQHRIKVESDHVLRAAGNQGNYLSWLDRFYGEKWPKTMAAACETMGGSRQLAEQHCSESHQQLVEIAGAVTIDGLADAVAETVEKWPHRAESLTDQILGELINV